MNYIDLLNQEEKSTLCSIIGGRDFRELFKRNEKEFSKIKKGFRAKSLTDAAALSTAVVNIDKPFIAMAINIKVDNWLKEIKDNIGKLESEGATYEIALASTMIDSFFVNNIKLYFKLIDQPLDVETYTKFLERMEHTKAERVKNSEMADRVKTLEKEKIHLLEQVETTQKSIEAIKAEYEQRIKIIEQDKKTLETLITETQKKLSELQTAPSGEKSYGAEYLSSFDDNNSSVLPPLSSDEIVSLCGIITDHNGQKFLIRHADLSHSGQYHIFRKNEEIPPFFTNRDKLFHKDGPSDDGFYGIWTWSTIPNENDCTKDYVISQYNKDIDAIEVVTFSDASSLDELIALLKDGVEYQPHSRRVMFAFYAKGQYVGVLCNIKDISSVNGKAVFADGFVSAPVYEFTYADIVRLNNGISFYGKAFAGIPAKLYQIKSPIEIVKNIVWNSISWSTYKSRGLTRAEYRTFKDFLAVIPIRDITGQIQAACCCSAPAAEDLLKKFLDSVYQYVDGDTLEDEIILSAISASYELQVKTKKLIRADWESENEALLAEAHSKLNELDSQLAQTNISLAEAQKLFEQTKSEEARVSEVIAEKEKLAEDVETTVAERIERARANVAEFIASMAFVGSQPVQVAVTESAPTKAKTPAPAVTQYHVVDAAQNLDVLEAHNNWSNVIDTAALELEEAGVATQYKRGLSAFLCSAFIEKQPILLVGPNALDIIRAFSAAISAQKYGVLNCEGDFSSQVIDEIGSAGEEIVAINNLLISGWMNRLPEILFQKDIFFIATHPYAEDIQVEPKSMYGFMLPLFTEFFVNKKATGKYYGGYFTDNFKKYAANKEAPKEIKALSHFTMNALIRNRISSLVATMHGIDSATTSDDDFLFAVFPFAYATMAFDDMAEVISDSQRGISISATLRRDLQYILGDA